MTSRPPKFKPGEMDVAMRARELLNLLAQGFGEAAGLYAKLEPDGRRLSPSEAAKVRKQLIAVTLCLREVQKDHEVIDYLVATGRRARRDGDARPTISLMRMMQRGFGLALSDDAARREQAAPATELAAFAIPVVEFWREIQR